MMTKTCEHIFYWAKKRLLQYVVMFIILTTFVVNVTFAQDISLSSIWYDSANIVVSMNTSAAGTYEFEFCYPGCVPVFESFSAGSRTFPFGGIPLALNTVYSVRARRQGLPTWSNTVSCRTNRNAPIIACGQDSDNDGYINEDDACPSQGDIGLGLQSNGCPILPLDTDGDGVPDDQDRCDFDPGPIQLLGCPDRDGDGIPDIDDACPNRAGPPSNNGCPVVTTPDPNIEDRDKDGLSDLEDICPDNYGPRENQGCPYPVITSTPEPNRSTNTPTPEPVTAPDFSKPCNLAPRPNGGSVINVRSTPEEITGNIVGAVTQSGITSGPYKVLAVSLDGAWYQIGTSIDSAEVKGWIAKSQTRIGGTDCDLVTSGPISIATSVPSRRELNAQAVESLTQKVIADVLSDCPHLSSDYLALISNLESLGRPIAEAAVMRVASAGEDTCGAIEDLLNEANSTLSEYSIGLCLGRVSDERMQEIVALANQLRIMGQPMQNPCGAVQNLSLLGNLQGDALFFYETLTGQCQASVETALNVLVYAIQEGVDLRRIAENSDFCVNWLELIANPDNKRLDIEVYPELSQCDPKRVTAFIFRISQDPPPLTPEQIERIVEASNPCQAIRLWMLYGILPPEKPVITATPTSTPTPISTISPNSNLGPTATLEPTPTLEVAPTQAVQSDTPRSGQQTIFLVKWLEEAPFGSDNDYRAAFIAPSDDTQTTDIYTFQRNSEGFNALNPNSPINERRPAISNSGDIAYIYTSVDGTVGIRLYRSNQTTQDILIPDDWIVSEETASIAWGNDPLYLDALYFTILNPQGQPVIWKYAGGSASEVIYEGWNVMVSGDWLVYSMGEDIKNQFFIPLSDPDEVREGTRLQPVSSEQECGPYNAFGSDELITVCGTAFYVIKFENGIVQSTRIFETGTSNIRNLARFPYLENYVTWDDGNSVFYCRFDSGNCNPVAFISLADKNVTSLVWR